jgi:glycerol-3-phosphate acyltransferase PlsY
MAATLPVVVSGHVWPVQMQLRGGRGLSTAFGAALVLAPLIPLGVVALAALLTALTRRISASVLVAIVPAPLIGAIGGAPPATIASVATTIVIVLFAHRTMIRAMIVRRSSASATGLVGRGDDAGSAGPAASGAPVPPKGPAR